MIEKQVGGRTAVAIAAIGLFVVTASLSCDGVPDREIAELRAEAAQNRDAIEGIVGSMDDAGSAELAARMARIEESLAELSERGSEPSSGAAAGWGPSRTLRNAINGAKQGEVPAECPAGQYVAGLVAVDRDGGRYCTTCISGVRLICRDICAQ